jgi:signal transduction histidine kinase
MNNRQENMAMIREFRNPLDNIQLSVNMLRSVIHKGDEEIYLDVIDRSALRIDNFINSFLIPEPAKLTGVNSIHQLLYEVLEIAGEKIARKQVIVIKQFTATDNIVVLNKPATKFALVNIIMNLIDTMPHGEGSLKIKTKMVHDKYVVRIESNGRSVSGLATAFFMLRSNQVGIDVESEDGRGIVFVLFFKNTPA